MEFLSQLNTLLWGDGLVVLLMGTGLLCLFRMGRAAHEVRGKRPGNAPHPVFSACMTSLGAAMGTGNIAGVASALAMGGAGAVFWMWVAGLCGMGLLYAENVLSARYRRGTAAGAVGYLRYGLGSAVLAGGFAVCCVLSSFGMGCMTQTHTMAETLSAAFQVPAWVTGLLAGGIAAAVLLGGAERIGKFMTAAVPLVSVVYLVMGTAVIFRFRSQLGAAFGAVFRGAFGWDAVTGGMLGDMVRRAVTVGVRRGVFSNEAGLGSSGLLHSGTDAPPEQLGWCAVLELLADTFVCCPVTAFALLTAGSTDVPAAFRAGIGGAADWLLPPVIAVFALCTLIGWSFCGGQAWQYLTDGRGLRLYQAGFCIAAGVGACMQADVVWTVADIANALMAYCNLPAVSVLFLPISPCNFRESVV